MIAALTSHINLIQLEKAQRKRSNSFRISNKSPLYDSENTNNPLTKKKRNNSICVTTKKSTSNSSGFLIRKPS